MFVHLHTHTEYSLLDGACRIDELLDTAVEFGMPAVAITDHGVMYGAVEFYKKAMARGIKPIIGCEAYVAQRTRFDRTPKTDDFPYHLVLLCQNEVGYRNLMKLVSAAYIEGFYYKPRVDWELLEEYNQGLIALSGCLAGEIQRNLLSGRMEQAIAVAKRLGEVFPGRFYLELQDNGVEGQKELNKSILEISRMTGIPVVATNDVHYLKKTDARTHDILLCIQTNKTIDDPDRMRFPTSEFYFKPAQEMEGLFDGLPEALSNTLVIAEQCSLELQLGTLHLPRFETPDGSSLETYLRKKARNGAELRYGRELNSEVARRLEYELDVIEKMGFAGYFLIVSDFIDFARQAGISVGPGRGSAAGSLVAYCLGITNIDPLKYGLLFERFLNPERVSMPDIDIDFADHRRSEVIDYVVRNYGSERVAQIVTFGTMAARAAIRDVGRALQIPYGEVDRIAKLVPAETGISLDRAIESTPELKAVYDSDDRIRLMLDTARAVEGLPRHASVHAAGVVIGESTLTDYVPLARTNDDAIVTQYPMEILEDIGLLKMDFLGLRTLTVIEKAVGLIRKSGEPDFDIESISLEDPGVYAMLSNADTTGVFQLESSLFRSLLSDIKPSRFEDIVAVLALGRPGPMARVEDYANRKNGRSAVAYEHPALEPILSDTYGVMIYQEQVMRIAMDVAGYSPGQADLLRKAMGKKKPEVMAAERQRFIEGAVKRGTDQKVAERLFDEIEKFAGYGFNKAHSAAYALVSYQTAYLKAHYPVQYLAALLSSVVGSSDKIAGYIQYCRETGIEVLPPDVNESDIDFSASNRAIRFGLAAVKNVGKATIESILEARQSGGPFSSIYDFCERVDFRCLNKKALESLIKCGALDSLGMNRAQLLMALDGAMEAGHRRQEESARGQTSLFQRFEGQVVGGVKIDPELEKIPEMAERELLKMEKEVLGVYLSGHPLHQEKEVFARLTSTNIREISEFPDGACVTIGGIVLAVKKINTRSGAPMAFITLEDLTASVEVIVLPAVYEQAKELLFEDSAVIIRGRVDIKDEEIKLVADLVFPLLERYAEVRLRSGSFDQGVLSEIKRTILENSGHIPVLLRFVSGGKTITAVTGRQYWVSDPTWLDRTGTGDGARP